MGRYFGTDGIRGRAGEPPLDPATVQAIGRAIVRAVGSERGLRVLIGRDTRESGPAIEQHLAAGLHEEGAQVDSAGVIPTPGIAHLAQARGGASRRGYDLGVVISASHNPYEDNGIKVFGGKGRKFSDELETRTEQILDELPRAVHNAPSVHQKDLNDAYLRGLRKTYKAAPLDGMPIVIDCANGATSFLAQRLFESIGAKVIAIHDQPDGRNINRGCGATVPQTVAAAVKQHKAALGIAFDGDGDRCIMADGNGKVVDGDHILFLAARHLKETGRLKGGAVVATIMSNVGLEIALKAHAIPLVRTAVGDRNVLVEMERRGANVGGEQSGHVIFLDHEPTGDGMLTALKILEVVRETGRTLADLSADLTTYPQLLVNVRVKEKADVEEIADIRKHLDAARGALDGRGRLVVRYSGTEPLLRVMAEGPDQDELKRLVGGIADAVKARIGA